jgi:hypothetical protein
MSPRIRLVVARGAIGSNAALQLSPAGDGRLVAGM